MAEQHQAPPGDPKVCRFSREHEWLYSEGQGVAWIGISDFAAKELGDIVYVQLPEPGTKIKQFQKFGEIESVKAASDLFAPASGEVLEANAELIQRSELVNQSPHQLGWMLRVRLDNPAEAENLLDYDAYGAFLQDLLEESM